MDMKRRQTEVPIYISLTSIFKNQDALLLSLQSILEQTRKPDKIFLYLSEEPYMLDDGFKDKKITNSNLLKFLSDNSIIDINWVKNTGPYRKLLPLLKEKWEEDCIIITIDDDTVCDKNLIKNLVGDYHKYKCVIGYRGFTPRLNKFENFNYQKRKLDTTTKRKEEGTRGMPQKLSLYNFLTGKGGVVYKPDFFHETKNLIFNEEIYSDTCRTNDDIWFYIVRILNNVECYLDNKKWLEKDINTEGLYDNFNNRDNNNTVLFVKTLAKLKTLGYNFGE
tara:strand:+ start:945 stop:1778 length:834 start_codon:yes stop_codon:yes gene_type:complete